MLPVIFIIIIVSAGNIIINGSEEKWNCIL
jgi:hypothetical protein